MTEYYHPEYTSYYATDSGKIYNSKTGRELKGTRTKDGYIRISIRPRGASPISLPAHEFIWEARHKEETNKYFKIIHIDGNKLNNKPDKLKQVLNQSSNPSNIERQILAVSFATGETRKFESIYQASQTLQINAGSIKLIAEGKRKTATSKLKKNKYTFKYSNPHDLDVVKFLKNKLAKKVTPGNTD